jgi:protein tyrosine phosphatase type 4A
MINSLIVIQSTSKKFVITDTPTDSSIVKYFELYKKHNIRTIVRTCKPMYSSIHFEHLGMKVIDLFIDDGNYPDVNIIEKWLDVVKEEDNIAVHCVAGLGRSPLLVCIGLIQFERMEPIDAIEIVRKEKPNTLNSKQIDFLIHFKPILLKSSCCLIS